MTVSTKPTRRYFSLPDPGNTPESHSAFLRAVRAALQTHERRDKDILHSFLRLGELVELGLLKIEGDQILIGDEVGNSSDSEETPGVTDHGALSGLGDDDHPQYLLRSDFPLTIKGASWSSKATSAISASEAPNISIQCPVSGTIVGVTVTTTGGTGSCVIDVEKSTYAGYPTTTSITAAAKPTISSGTKYTDTTLTGWTTAITAGDVLKFQLESSSVFTNITIILHIQESP